MAAEAQSSRKYEFSVECILKLKTFKLGYECIVLCAYAFAYLHHIGVYKVYVCCIEEFSFLGRQVANSILSFI